MCCTWHISVYPQIWLLESNRQNFVFLPSEAPEMTSKRRHFQFQWSDSVTFLWQMMFYFEEIWIIWIRNGTYICWGFLRIYKYFLVFLLIIFAFLLSCLTVLSHMLQDLVSVVWDLSLTLLECSFWPSRATRFPRFSVRFVDSTDSGCNPSDGLAECITWTGATGQDSRREGESRRKLWILNGLLTVKEYRSRQQVYTICIDTEEYGNWFTTNHSRRITES